MKVMLTPPLGGGIAATVGLCIGDGACVIATVADCYVRIHSIAPVWLHRIADRKRVV